MPERGSWLWRVPASKAEEIDQTARVLGIERSKLMHLIVSRGMHHTRYLRRGLEAPPEGSTRVVRASESAKNTQNQAEIAPVQPSIVLSPVPTEPIPSPQSIPATPDEEWNDLAAAFGYTVKR